MDLIETFNRLSESWASFMLHRFLDSTLVFAFITAIWMTIRKRTSPQAGYCLYLLVLIKLIIPFEISIPDVVSSYFPDSSIARQASFFYIDEWANPERMKPSESMKSIAPSDEDEKDAKGMEKDAVYTPSLSSQIDESVIRSTPQLMVYRPIALVWALVTIFLLALFGWSEIASRHLLKCTHLLKADQFPIDLLKLQKIAKIKQSVRWLTADWVKSPMAYGFIKPAVIIPTNMDERFNVNQLRWILLHELAHIRRRDSFVAFFQKIIQIIFFFHPIVWLTNNRINQLREYACDDEALIFCDIPRADCGEGLLSLVRQTNNFPAFMTVPLGIIDYKTQVRRRMMRILDTERKLKVGLSAGMTILLLFVACVLLPTVKAENKFVTNKSKSNSTFPYSTKLNLQGIYPTSISPDGLKIIGIQYNENYDKENLVLYDFNANTIQTLLDDHYCVNAIWDTKGKNIAINYYDDQGVMNISIYNLETENIEAILNKTTQSVVDWSPDGESLLCTENNKDTQKVSLINLESKEINFLFEDNHDAGGRHRGGLTPSFSPDGRYVVYLARKKLLENSIKIFNLETSEFDEFKCPPIWMFFPTWSEKGDSIIFIGYSKVHLDVLDSDIFSIPVKDGKFEGIPKVVHPDFFMNEIIAFGKGNDFLYQKGQKVHWMYVLPIDIETGKPNGNPKRIVKSGPSVYLWGPEGKYIIQQRMIRGLGGYSFISIDNGMILRDITAPNMNAFDRSQRYLPNKQMILSGSIDEKGRKGIFGVDVENGKIELLKESSTYRNLYPSVTPDGKILVYSEKGTIFSHDLTTNTTHELFSSTSFFTSPSISPFGKQIVYAKHEQETFSIMISSIDGKQSRELFRKPLAEVRNPSLEWSPDGQFIIFSVGRYIKSDKLWLISTDDGEISYIKIPNEIGIPYYPLWSPDGKYISFFAYNDIETEYWMLNDIIKEQ